MAKPTIVLVHGIWHSPLSYAKLTSSLRQKGYTVEAPYLPSCIGARPPIASLPQDTALVRRLVEQLSDLGQTIILVMHSYGGVVGCGAVEGLDVKSRKSAGKAGGVAALISLAAHIHPKGFAMFDLVREMGNEDLIPVVFDINVDGSCFATDAKGMLCTGMQDAEIDELMKTWSRASAGCFEDKVQFEAWKHLPLTYVLTTEDTTVPPHYQHHMLEKLEKAGCKADVVEMATGHSLYITKTEEVVKVIDNVAEKFA